MAAGRGSSSRNSGCPFTEGVHCRPNQLVKNYRRTGETATTAELMPCKQIGAGKYALEELFTFVRFASVCFPKSRLLLTVPTFFGQRQTSKLSPSNANGWCNLSNCNGTGGHTITGILKHLWLEEIISIFMFLFENKIGR